ncbi:MAG: trypsin-like peptidase domain-containing protein [Ornithinimicrobium sp.]
MSSTSPGRSSTHAGRRIRSIDLFAVASLSAVLAAGGTYGLVSVGDDGPVVSAPGQSIDSAKDAPSNATPASITGDLNWTGVADQVAPSVVSIQVLTANGGGEGSGVVWDDAGHIVTNAHVVDGGQEVRVTLNDGRSYPAEITGSDPSTDLAVLQLSDIPEGLTPIDIGDDQALSVGSPVMAIGNPLGLSGTVTTGIVSAMDRPVSTAPTSNDPNSGAVTNAIQTSAAINPGNSGGALVDGSGRLIGINSAIASLPSASGETSGNIGIGFAIPMATANGIIDQLIDGGVAEHAFLGVSLTSGEGITGGAVLTGAEVTSVEPGSPAAGGDLQAGDVIVSIDGERVGSSTALVAQVRERASGSEAQIGYLRNGETAEVVVTLDTRPDTGG